MLYKSTALRVKDLDAKQGIIQAYWSAFGNEDDGGDIVVAGAFTKSIQEWGPGARQPRIKYLYQHDSSQLLGVPSALVQDDFGLLATAQIVKTTLGQDVLLLYEAGVITEHSIGYETVLAAFDQKLRARLLQQLKLYEGSAVTWGMNSQTPTVAVKSLTDAGRVRARVQALDKLLHDAPLRTDAVAASLEGELKALKSALDAFAPPARRERPVDIVVDALKIALATLEAKGASGKSDWPLGDRNAAWDNGEAHAAIEKWADGDTSKLKSVHFWSPTGDDAQDISKYKLLFCDVVGGDVQAMPRGIFACAGAHGVDAADIPEGDKDAVRGKIEGYYSRMAKEFDDSSIVAPWKADAGKAGSVDKDTKPATRGPRRPAKSGKARDFNTVYTTDRDPWDLLEDLDDMWQALRESITGILIEGSASNGDNATLAASLSQFAEAVTEWTQMAEMQDCWGEIADSAEEYQDRVADAYTNGYGAYYYMALVRAHAEAKGAAHRVRAPKDAPDAPGEVKKGAALSGSNRDVLTKAADGIAAAMGDMKQHHKSIKDLLEKTAPPSDAGDATGDDGPDGPGQDNEPNGTPNGKGGKASARRAATKTTAPDRSQGHTATSDAGTTRDVATALSSALAALEALPVKSK